MLPTVERAMAAAVPLTIGSPQRVSIPSRGKLQRMKSKPPRILVYSSQALVLFDLKDMLDRLGKFEAVPFSSLRHAIASIGAQDYAAALVDESGAGFEAPAMQELRHGLRGRFIPFASLVTGDEWPGMMAAITQATEVVILKPVDESRLRATMKSLIAASARPSR